MTGAKLSVWRELVLLLAAMTPAARIEALATMTPADLLRLDAEFDAWRHESQLPPDGAGWRTWLMLAGRGFGKTRAGSEWIHRLATQRRRPVRIALVGATIDDARKVMVEGQDGLLVVGRRHRRVPTWEPTLGLLRWPGGSVAEIFSGADPDGLRGPQHDYAWCDELAKWACPDATWAILKMGLRCGERPRALVTTTPRPMPLLKRLMAARRTVITRGRTDDNVTLPLDYLEEMAETYGGTRLGRQELGGELIEDVEGALWTRALVESARVAPMGTVTIPHANDNGSQGMGTVTFPHGGDGSGEGLGNCPRHCPLTRIVIGVDPPASAAGDACGIVACGRGADGLGYVLGDHSVSGLSPEGWARAVVRAAEAWRADRVIVETNQGGEMVQSVLRSVDSALPVRAVKARFGKGKRAEPVAILFEAGKAKFAGVFPDLEDQLCGLTAGGGYEGPGRSPDRADAMVWAMAELMLRARREPRIWGF